MLHPPLTKSYRKFNPKIKALKRDLNLILSIRGTEGAGNLISLMTSDFQQITVFYSYGFKNVQKMIEMALKLLFLQQNHKNRPADGGFAPRPLL